MEILKDIGRFIWAVLSIWQAYMTGGIVIALLGIYERVAKKTISLKTFIIGVIAFLLVAFFLAWRDEYRTAQHAQAELEAKYKPHFVGEIDQIAAGLSLEDQRDSVMTVIATIHNSGAPSVATHFLIKLITADRVLDPIPIPPPAGPLRLDANEGGGLSFTPADYLPRAAGLQLIPTNGIAHGYLLLLVKGMTKHEIFDGTNRIRLDFDDATGNHYSIERPIGHKGPPLPDGRKIGKEFTP